jgi:hypothetical protein
MAADPITAGLTLAGDVVKLTDDELSVLNSPANQASRQAWFEQKQRELDAEAVAKAQQGNPIPLEERSS